MREEKRSCVFEKTLSFFFARTTDLLLFLWELTCLFRLVLSAGLIALLSGKEPSPDFHLVEPASGERQKMIVGAGAAKIRPYVVCAVLRGVSFNAKNYKSFMDLQVMMMTSDAVVKGCTFGLELSPPRTS